MAEKPSSTKIKYVFYHLEPGYNPSVATLHLLKRSAHVGRAHIQSFHRRGQFLGESIPLCSCFGRSGLYFDVGVLWLIHHSAGG